MKTKTLFAFLALALFISCETATGPNEIGGETNLELTKVGAEFGVSPKIKGQHIPALENLRDSVFITKNDNGIVTFTGSFFTDLESLRTLDTLFGTQSLPENMKHQIVDAYMQKWGFTIDTSDHDNLRLDFEFKLKITSEGIQDFVYSGGDLSKPFTIVKYSANVGDKYEFTGKDGKKVVRTVVQKDPLEDWYLAFWMVKTIRVEQDVADDPVIKKVTFITNHKFGLVGFIHEFHDGRIIETTILPWDML